MAAADLDSHVEGFLALLAARRAPRTVEAYRRDLSHLAAFLGGSAQATTEDLERYLAELRAAGRAPATIARRAAAMRAFFRHQQLLSARDDNPAADLDLPRRRRKLPRTLSPGEAERLIEAAAGTQPRDLRDRALIELLYGAGLRVSEAVSLEKGGISLDDRLVRCIGKGDKERIVPIGRQAVDALRRYLARGRPLPRPAAPPGALSERAGRSADARGRLPDPAPACREGRPRPDARSSAPAPPLVCDPSAGRRRRPAQRAGDARPRRPVDDRALHARIRSASPRVVLPGAPARAGDDPRRKMTTQSLSLVLSATGVGYLMVKAGLGKNALELRQRRRICPSCGREITGRRCDAH